MFILERTCHGRNLIKFLVPRLITASHYFKLFQKMVQWISMKFLLHRRSFLRTLSTKTSFSAFSRHLISMEEERLTAVSWANSSCAQSMAYAKSCNSNVHLRPEFRGSFTISSKLLMKMALVRSNSSNLMRGSQAVTKYRNSCSGIQACRHSSLPWKGLKQKRLCGLIYSMKFRWITVVQDTLSMKFWYKQWIRNSSI